MQQFLDVYDHLSVNEFLGCGPGYFLYALVQIVWSYAEFVCIECNTSFTWTEIYHQFPEFPENVLRPPGLAEVVCYSGLQDSAVEDKKKRFHQISHDDVSVLVVWHFRRYV